MKLTLKEGGHVLNTKLYFLLDFMQCYLIYLFVWTSWHVHTCILNQLKSM